MMKNEHKEIIDKITEYFNRTECNDLRFWQGLRNMDIIRYEETYRHPNPIHNTFNPVDDYNISDERLLKRIKL